MSHPAVNWAFDLPEGTMGPTTKFVLVCLCSFADDNFTAFPGQKTLARKTGLSESSVRRALKELDQCGLITRARRKRKDGSRTSDFYTINVGAYRSEGLDLPVRETGKQPVTVTGHEQSDSSLTVREQSDIYMFGVERPRITLAGQCDKAVNIWNEMASQNSLPKVMRLTSARKAKLMARLRECGGVQGWYHACEKVVQSDFLLGRVNGWRANFDFMVREGNFTKLMEGGYDQSGAQNGNGGGKGRTSDRLEGLADVFEELTGGKPQGGQIVDHTGG